MTIHTDPAASDSIKKSLVALRMPRALEMLDVTLRLVEQGEITWVDALDNLLLEELTLRDNRRVRGATCATVNTHGTMTPPLKRPSALRLLGKIRMCRGHASRET